MDFGTATRALVYVNGKLKTNDGERTCFRLDGGKLNLTLNAGYAVLGFNDGNIVKSGVSFLCERMIDTFDDALAFILYK